MPSSEEGKAGCGGRGSGGARPAPALLHGRSASRNPPGDPGATRRGPGVEGAGEPGGRRGAAGQLRSRPLLQVAAKALETGTFGAYFNVLINLKDITDDEFKDQVSARGLGRSGTGTLSSGLRLRRVALGMWPSAEMFLWPPRWLLSSLGLLEARGCASPAPAPPLLGGSG